MNTLEEMTAMLAHELRNHLAVIKLATYSLQQECTKDDEVIHRHLDNMNRRIDLSDKMIQDLVAFARLSQTSPTTLQVNEYVDKVFGSIANKFEEQNILLEKDLTSDDTSVQADKQQLFDLLLNLLTTAFESMRDSKQKTLGISTLAENGTVTVKISSTGKTPDEKDLGLYIADKIAKNNKGNLLFENNDEQKFAFTLKLIT